MQSAESQPAKVCSYQDIACLASRVARRVSRQVSRKVARRVASDGEGVSHTSRRRHCASDTNDISSINLAGIHFKYMCWIRRHHLHRLETLTKFVDDGSRTIRLEELRYADLRDFLLASAKPPNVHASVKIDSCVPRRIRAIFHMRNS